MGERTEKRGWVSGRWLAAGVVLVAVPGAAVAEIGPAFSGLTGSATDATAAFLSPAGIVRLAEPNTVVQTAFAYTEARFEVDEASFDGGNADKDNGILVIPGIFYTRPLTDRWHLGLSLNVPSGIGNDYGRTWAGRYKAEAASLTFLATTATLAYQLTDRWSVAAGPVFLYTDSKTKARVNNLAPGAKDGSVRLEEEGGALGLTFGAMFQWSERTRIGATYRTATDPELEGTPSFSNLDPLLREILAAADLLGTEVDVDFKVPRNAQGGFYTELSDRWSVTGDLLWVNMSEFGLTRVSVEQDSIALPQGDFRDAWITTVGAKYRYRGDRAVSFGAIYGTSPISDGRRGIGLPLDRTVGVGAGLERPCFGHRCRINLNYLDLGDGDLSEEGGPLTGDIAGSFDRNWALMLDLQLHIGS